jgi:hypothetical protein
MERSRLGASSWSGVRRRCARKRAVRPELDVPDAFLSVSRSDAAASGNAGAITRYTEFRQGARTLEALAVIGKGRSDGALGKGALEGRAFARP